MKIETARLTIRNFTVDDWKSLQEMIIQKESSQYAIYDHEWPTTEKEIKRITEWFANGNSYFAVCLKKTGKLIGFVSLANADGEENREFGLGFCFNSDYHGKGYATEGCKAVVKYAFSDLKAEKVTCGTAAANSPSCNLLGRLGMKKTSEGIASFRKTLDGKPIEFSGLTFTILKDEWFKANTIDRHQ